MSFDVYGTLIDWEPAMLASVRELITAHLPASHPYNTDPPTAALMRLDALARELEAPTQQPTLPYNEVLARALTLLGVETGVGVPDVVAADFGRTPSTWPPFADTVPALQKLRRHYGALIAVSNVDNANIAVTVAERLAPARFDAVYTAEDIGSYKPSHRNFEYLFAHAKKDLGVDWEKGDLLHVARR
ncbi:hypothetical protein SLS62_001045 [Diatrype stigma]|uniref:Haloacid dehalogenase n=1 Tax=Diatrype stigma TaxID=117547 RepID=A0AAN9UWV9_9PEZI